MIIRHFIGYLGLKRMITLGIDTCSSIKSHFSSSYLLNHISNAIINVLNFQNFDNIFRQLDEQISGHLLLMSFCPFPNFLEKAGIFFAKQTYNHINFHQNTTSFMQNQASLFSFLYLPFSFHFSLFVSTFLRIYECLNTFIIIYFNHQCIIFSFSSSSPHSLLPFSSRNASASSTTTRNFITIQFVAICL